MFAEILANTLMGTKWNYASLERSTVLLCGKQYTWISYLIHQILRDFPKPPHHTKALTRFISDDFEFRRAMERGYYNDHWIAHQIDFAEERFEWPVKQLRSPEEFAAWLRLSVRELDWFTDEHGKNSKHHQTKLSHYTYQWITKSHHRWRLLECPKSRLKEIQRSILEEILNQVSPHSAACGFCRQGSILKYVTPHVGKRVVVHLDLEDFFPSIKRALVFALFRTLGYRESVANLLTGLCTNSVPFEIWKQGPESIQPAYSWHAKQFESPHLPQGSPTSPALANLAAYRLDLRLSALARTLDIQYTRYADDMAFSGDETFLRGIKRFLTSVYAIVLDCGFRIQPRKTNVMKSSQRQQLTGIVLNEHANIKRKDYDQLKALLNNCIRLGPDSQNRKQHSHFREYLLGKIAFVNSVNEKRGERLKELFGQIKWEQI